ncbi:MAG: hypothetical protein SFW63_04890 [Alphaproteobacteria bacterium]|nr:hypothetical protein [Alphaproteobacteria bacterium]
METLHTPPTEPDKEPAKRTPGLKLFDVVLYPIVTNLAVFGISVGATYLTSRGGDRTKEGKLIYGKVGEFFQQRGDWLMDKFKSMGMNHESANVSKMVFSSFLDGSLLAPVVKLVEDRREKIGKWFDDKMGTTPENDDAYKAEPKQSWLSVLGGRFITAGIVAPTAYLLDKKIGGASLNYKMFTEPGEKLGSWLQTKKLPQWIAKHDLKTLSGIGIFELFYTSVCTAGLYVSSRFIARKTEKKPTASEPAAPVETPAPREEKPAKSYVATIDAQRQQAASHVAAIV